jgi:NAD-dependent dihydropyrimidine dehydrogenase PreA subunit
MSLLKSEIGNEVKEQIKAIAIGTKFYNPFVLDCVIDEKSPLENGVITVFDNTYCMADLVERAIFTVRKESCGKCTFCREGSIQIHTIMKDITSGKGKSTDLPLIKEIAEAMSYYSLCSTGHSGANFVLFALEKFGEEIDSHIRKKRCPAESCTAFMKIYIDPSTCSGCTDCLDVCPVNCIEGKSGYIHIIDEFDCTKCGKCMDVCSDDAVMKTTGRLPKLPERLTRVGRFNRR